VRGYLAEVRHRAEASGWRSPNPRFIPHLEAKLLALWTPGPSDDGETTDQSFPALVAGFSRE
jgi:hypothetical protein